MLIYIPISKEWLYFLILQHHLLLVILMMNKRILFEEKHHSFIIVINEKLLIKFDYHLFNVISYIYIFWLYFKIYSALSIEFNVSFNE